MVELQSPHPYGSSPHTRGAPPRVVCWVEDYRIIPAYAGSTCLSAMQEVCGKDHPRIRGEHVSCSSRMSILTGSSPHTRGAPDTGLVTDLPALDHPRIRGEHARSRPPRPDLTGSSPHTRGAP